MSVPTDFSFPRQYECEVLEELPGGDTPSHLIFSPAHTRAERMGCSSEWILRTPVVARDICVRSVRPKRRESSL